MTDIASAFLLDLHRSSRRLPHAELRAWIFANLKSVVAFDSAFWFRWAAHDGQSHIHAWCLHGQPDSLIHEYTASELWKDDVVYSRTLNADRGTAIRASYDDYSSVRMRDFLRRHRQEHIMTIAIMQDVPQTAVGMSLYRNETHEAFLAEDGRAFEAVMPHVVDAWRENWLRDIVRATSTAPAPVNFSMALLKISNFLLATMLFIIIYNLITVTIILILLVKLKLNFQILRKLLTLCFHIPKD